MRKPAPFLSGSMLKLLAMTLMLIDHTAHYILSQIPFFTTPLVVGISLYTMIRLATRIVFPLYAFLLVEGFIHTRDRKKYGLNLLIFALISELPWNFVHTGTLFAPSQNVMFTLFFSYLALCAIEHLDKNRFQQLLALLALFVICTFGKMDYGARGFGLVLIMYLLRQMPAVQAIAGTCMLNNGWAAGFAFIPINLYNGQRGFMKGRFAKYIAYVFYPAHLLLLGILKYYVM